jgi:hypothetical protein
MTATQLPRQTTVSSMTVKRPDNTGIVVENLDAAMACFTELEQQDAQSDPVARQR